MKLGDRMKAYEEVTDMVLLPATPFIIRLDGRAFHTFTKGLNKPFDDNFSEVMCDVMQYLCSSIPNCVFGYTQSDEITLVVLPDIDGKLWFEGRVIKIASITASMATLRFNLEVLARDKYFGQDKCFSGMFDSRVFSVPYNDVTNNLIWRQQDATKNSVNAVAQQFFTHKELDKKSVNERQNMLLTLKDVNWNDTPVCYKRGVACRKVEKVFTKELNGAIINYTRAKWELDYNMPILTEDRNYVEDLLQPRGKDGK